MPHDEHSDASGRAVAGDLWAALEQALAATVGGSLAPPQQRELMGEFMAMGQTHDAERGQLVWGYKHIDTRVYLFLDAAGGAYIYDARGGQYVRTAPRDAIARARGAV